MKSKTDHPDKIIKLLIQHKSLRFTELRIMTGLSNPAISYHLKHLIDKKIIEVEKKGKERYYHISKGILKQFDSNLTLISKNYVRYFIEESNRFYPIDNRFLENKEYPDDEHPLDELIRDISEKLSALFFYSIIESMITGKNWTKLYDVNDMREEVLILFTNILFHKDKKNLDELTKLIYDSNLTEYFKKIKKSQDNRSVDKKIDLLYEILKINYLHEFEYLEFKAHHQVD